MSLNFSTQSKVFSTNKTLNIQGRLLDMSVPHIMGILNVTPDSFYAGSRFQSEEEALKQAEQMLADGASFIDVGGYSSRPGAEDIPVQEELKRAVNVIRAIVRRFPQARVSIDTFRSAVAAAAIDEGACMVNDISAGEADAEMIAVVSRLQVPYIVMHMRGDPQTMTQLTDYKDLIKDIADYFHRKIHQLHEAGIKDIIIDPGFGFAKTVSQNFEILNNLDYFKILQKPVLVGLSRKSMIWRTLNISPEEALNGTTALHAVAVLKGASILRVHDVREAVQVVKLLGMLDR